MVSFEQYQFMRYYLPGSTFFVYLVLVLAPLSSPKLAGFIAHNFSGLVSLPLAIFAASPVVGYIIYDLYDTFFYNDQFMDWDKRPLLEYMVKWAMNEAPEYKDVLKAIKKDKETCQKKLQPSIKGLIDFIIHSSKDGATGNLRPYWNNYAARFVCGGIVSLLVLGTFVLVISFDICLRTGLFQPQTCCQWKWWIIDWVVIALASWVIWRGKENPRSEAFELEYDVILANTADSDCYISVRTHFLERLKELPLDENFKKKIDKIIKNYFLGKFAKTQENDQEEAGLVSKIDTGSPQGSVIHAKSPAAAKEDTKKRKKRNKSDNPRK